MTDSATNEYFIKKALQGYDSEIELLKTKLKESNQTTQQIGAGLMNNELQWEALVGVLLAKEFFTEEELKASLEKVHEDFNKMFANAQTPAQGEKGETTHVPQAVPTSET